MAKVVRLAVAVAVAVVVAGSAGCASGHLSRSAVASAQDHVRVVQTADEVVGCGYVRTVSAAEQPYREGVTVFEQLRRLAYRAGGDTVQVQFVEGSPSGAGSVGPSNAITAKVYRCSGTTFQSAR